LSFMKENPTVKIEIEGHVNNQVLMDDSNDKFNQELSEMRAKAVYNYLISNGISSDRLRWIGYGSRRMLYPQAKNEYEEQQNRRVEVKILSY